MVLKPNLHHGREDTTSFDARAFFDHLASMEQIVAVERTTKVVAVNQTSGSKGLHHSTVQEQDHTRKEAVQKLIHQFETRSNGEAVKVDPKQNGVFNPFSEQSKEMINSMGNMVYCEISGSLPKYSATTVCHTGRTALYIVLAEHACDLQTKFGN